MQSFRANYRRILSLCLAFGLALFQNFGDWKDFHIDGDGTFLNITSASAEDNNLNYDDVLKNARVYSQKDDDWDYLPYRVSSIGEAGCGPLSIVNAFSLAFGIQSKDDAIELLKDVMKLEANVNAVNAAMFGEGRYNFSILDKLINQASGKVHSGSIDQFISDFTENDYFIDMLMFNDNSYSSLDEAIRHIYTKNPDTNVILYRMTGGTLNSDRAFGSISGSGHFVSLLISVREYVENNSVFLLDSFPRNLSGESDYGVSYNFVFKPYKPNFKRFNERFSVTRITDDIIKISTKEAFTSNDLSNLGLSGCCGIVIAPGLNNKTLKL